MYLDAKESTTNDILVIGIADFSGTDANSDMRMAPLDKLGKERE